MPKSLQATLDRTWNYTDRGNLSMKSQLAASQENCKFVTNNVPKKDKDLFVKTYVSNSVSDWVNTESRN